MTIAQIAAVLSLLLAFGVPQKEVDTVQTLLQGKNVEISTTTQSVQVTLPVNNAQQTPVFGATIQPMPTKNISIVKSQLAPYDIKAFYTEDGVPKSGIVITLSGDGVFTNINNSDLAQLDTATGSADDPKSMFKGSVQINSHPVSLGYGQPFKAGVYAVFSPNGDDQTVTATANGVTASN